jgi:glycine cleavage system H protein
MDIPDDLHFTQTHEWVREEDGELVVGITDFAQDQLSDVTFVELPSLGEEIQAADDVAVVESVKAASDVYAPVSGKIADINTDLEAQPELINTDPFGAGWLFRITPSQPAELDDLMSAEDYRAALPDDDG